MDSDQSVAANHPLKDLKTFETFFEGFYPALCVFARKYLKETGLAEDFAQEAFLACWHNRENFPDLYSIKGYLYTVTRHKCLNSIRMRRVREHILKDPVFSDDYFYEMVLEEETYHRLHSAVNKLANQSRRIILLALAGNKNEQIADRLNISLNTVKTLKKNAYRELRNRLVVPFVMLMQFCWW